MKRTLLLFALCGLSFSFFSACNRDKCPQHGELKKTQDKTVVLRPEPSSFLG